MKIAEIREIATNELAERIEAEVANYNQMVLNPSILPCSGELSFSVG